MPEIIDRRLSFNGGEFSPWTDSRIDLEKYRTACRQLQNMRPTVYGGAFRRPGFVRLGAAADQSSAVRLVEFEFSVTTTLVLEFSHLSLRVWTTGDSAGIVEDPDNPGTPYEIVTPWTASQIFALQFAQQNDVVFVAHPETPPHRLARLASDDWEIGPVELEWPPLLDANITATTLSAAAVTGAGVALTASAATFEAGHVGSIWLIRHRRADPSTSVALNAADGTASAALFVLGEWSCNVAVNTGGTWEKNAVVQRSYDKSTWETIRSISSSGVTSGTITGTELDPCWLRVRIETGTGSPPSSGSFVLEAFDPDHYGLARIAGVTDSVTAEIDVLFELGSTSATALWSESAWSGRRGYPRSVTFHENRLVFGGSASRPQTIWGSIIDDYLNFRTGTDDDMGFAFTLASDAANGVQWLVSQESLVIGTTGSEWSLGSRASDKALGPTTAAAKRSTNYGSAHIQARAVHDATLFVQRSSRKIREFVYTFEKDGYAAQDLTLLAEHITAGGIVQIAVQKNPETVVWCITGAGDLIGLTYERGQSVAGWFRYTTQGAFESIAVISGAGEEDELWVSVRRTIDGNITRHIERLQLDQINALKDGNPIDLVYLDSALVYDGAPTSTITGLDHLEGTEVAILADGSPHPTRTVLAGEVELQAEASTVIVGLAYDSLLEPTWFETGDPASVSKVAVKRITRAIVEVWRSLGMEISGDGGFTWAAVEFRAPDDHMDAAPPLFDGILEERIEAASERQSSLILRQSQPLPLNVVSLHVRYDLNTV